jgi:hypothetical protein
LIPIGLNFQRLIRIARHLVQYRPGLLPFGQMLTISGHTITLKNQHKSGKREGKRVHLWKEIKAGQHQHPTELISDAANQHGATRAHRHEIKVVVTGRTRPSRPRMCSPRAELARQKHAGHPFKINHITDSRQRAKKT